jgi:uncharacterized protein (DUF58 family)
VLPPLRQLQEGVLLLLLLLPLPLPLPLVLLLVLVMVLLLLLLLVLVLVMVLLSAPRRPQWSQPREPQRRPPPAARFSQARCLRSCRRRTRC